MKKLSNFFWPLVLFFLITAVFFWPVFIKGYIPFPGDLLAGNYEPYKSNSYFGWGPGAVPHKAQGPDVIRELYPWKFFAIESIKNGVLPWWNPYNFAGNPQLADFQTAAFYPLNFIFFLFSSKFAWTIFIFIQPILAGFFTYLFVKELGLKKIPAVFSGVVFAFSSFFTVWIEYGNIGHTFLWLPLALYLTEKIIKSFSWKKTLLLVGVLTLSILAGFIQVAIYLFATIIAYYLYRFFQAEKRKISQLYFLFLALVAPLALSFFQLLPTLELFKLSARDAYPQEALFRLLNPVYYSITTFIPDFFGHPAARNLWFWGTYIERVSYFGVIPLLFVLIAFLGKREKPFWFFATAAGVSYLLSLDILPTRFILGLNPPIISTAVPTRILSLFCFSGAILAGIGLNFWLEEKKKQQIIKLTAVFIAIYLLSWLFVFAAPKIFSSQPWIAYLGVTKRNLILPTLLALTGGGLILVGGWFSEKKKILALIVVIFTIFDLFYFFQKITPFSPKEFTYPKTPVFSFLKDKVGIDRFWGYGIASIETNFATQERIFSTDGSDALHIKRYGELLFASKDGKVVSPPPRRDANIASGYGAEDLKNNFFRQRILNLIGVKYILNKNDGLTEEMEADYVTFPQSSYELVWQVGAWQVYENKEVLPRLFLSGDYLVEKDDGKIIQKIFDKNFNLRTLILEENPNTEIGKSEKNTLKLEEYLPNQIRISASVEKPQLLFLSDSFYPGWHAYVDQKETKIYRAHYSFRAIVIPEGHHEVVFTYKHKFF